LAAGCASSGRKAAAPPASEPIAPEPTAAAADAEGTLPLAPGDFEAAAVLPERPVEPIALGDFEDVASLEPGGATRPVLSAGPPGRPRSVREELIATGDPCSEPKAVGEEAIDAARRRLFQTLCGAALWFDGLFGVEQHVGAAEKTTGRLELSFTDSAYWGFKARTRFHFRARFPNLDERINAFIGRDDEEEFVRDRNEGFALRSQFRHFEDDDDRWVAGLGYGLPGLYKVRTDFRVGGKGGREPEIFAQARLRRNFFIGDRSLWHLRPTGFWTNRKKWGTTMAIDFDHVLAPNVLFRWANVASWTEETEGLDWRVATVLYHNLESKGRAVAYETYVRGETDDEVPLREYGARAILRRPLKRREWLFGELYLGYGWPKEEIEEEREGSYSVGFGLELLFGRENRY
jgi:hypothetical protein